jgi:hypothetical protein
MLIFLLNVAAGHADGFGVVVGSEAAFDAFQKHRTSVGALVYVVDVVAEAEHAVTEVQLAISHAVKAVLLALSDVVYI